MQYISINLTRKTGNIDEKGENTLQDKSTSVPRKFIPCSWMRRDDVIKYKLSVNQSVPLMQLT